MEEVWRDIKGYEGLYQVSNLGRVRSLRNYSGIHKKYYKYEKIMKLVDNGKGYLTVMLSKNKTKKHKYIHRLVAENFIPNPKNFLEVNHMDENKKNNQVDNLEWCDRDYNNNFGTKNNRYIEKVGKKVEQIDIKTNQVFNTFTSMREASRQTGIVFSTIQGCCNGKYKKAGGYKWRYANDKDNCSKQYQGN